MTTADVRCRTADGSGRHRGPAGRGRVRAQPWWAERRRARRGPGPFQRRGVASCDDASQPWRVCPPICKSGSSTTSRCLSRKRRSSAAGVRRSPTTFASRSPPRLTCCCWARDRTTTRLRQIPVYPDAFVVHHERPAGDGLVQAQSKALTGESWAQGQVVLSWAEALAGAADPADGRNVVLHEFAHQIDQDTGASNGRPWRPGGDATAMGPGDGCRARAAARANPQRRSIPTARAIRPSSLRSLPSRSSSGRKRWRLRPPRSIANWSICTACSR